MRFFRFDPSVLICSLQAWNILQGVQPMEFIRGPSRSHSTTHLNLEPSDQVDSNYMKDQLKGLVAREQSSETMTSESSSASPVTAACQKLDKASLPKKNKITLEIEAIRFYIQTLNNLDNWESELLQSRLTIEEKSNVEKKLQIVKQQVGNLYEPKLQELRGKQFNSQDDTMNEDPLEMISVPGSLDSAFQVVEFLPRAQWQEKVGTETVERGYDVMFNLLIDMLQLQILSKEQVSHFLNSNQDVQLVLSHVLNRLDKYGRINYSDLYHKMDAKGFISDSLSDNLKEAQLLRFLDQNTWLKVSFDFEVGLLMPSLQIKEDKIRFFRDSLEQFFQKQYTAATKVPEDQILSFKNSFYNHFLKNFKKKPEDNEIQKLKIDRIYLQFKIELFRIILHFLPFSHNEDYKLLNLIDHHRRQALISLDEIRGWLESH